MLNAQNFNFYGSLEPFNISSHVCLWDNNNLSDYLVQLSVIVFPSFHKLGPHMTY